MKQKKVNQKGRNWLLEIVWADNAYIEQAASAYDTTPWYKSMRFGLLCLVIGSLLLTALLFKQWAEMFFLAVFMIPLGYFVMRGYRFTFVLIGLFKLYDAILRITAVQPGHVWSIFIWTALWLGLAVTCYRIETARRKLFKESLKITKTDKVVFGIFGAIILAYVGLFAIGKLDTKGELEDKYGAQNVRIIEEFYIYTNTVIEICEPTWRKVAEIHSKEIKRNFSYDDLKEAYLANYFALNENVWQKMPDGLGYEFKQKLGNKTTSDFRKSIEDLGKSKGNIAEVYYTVCTGFLNMSEDELKIKY